MQHRADGSLAHRKRHITFEGLPNTKCCSMEQQQVLLHSVYHWQPLLQYGTLVADSDACV